MTDGNAVPGHGPLKAKEFVDEIKTLMDSPWVKAELERPANFWDIMEYGRDSYENRYSKMLKWLMDPTASHDLGYFFARQWALAAIAKRRRDREAGQVSPEDAIVANDKALEADLLASTDDQVSQKSGDSLPFTDTGALKKDIDIFYDDPAMGFCLTVEAKMESGLHTSPTADGGLECQLVKYHRAVEGPESEYPDYRDRPHHLYVFWSEGGELPHESEPPIDGVSGATAVCADPTACQNLWVAMSYPDLEPLLERVIARLVWNHNTHARKIVEDFYFNSRRRTSGQHTPEVEQFLGLVDGEEDDPRGYLRETVALLNEINPDALNDSADKSKSVQEVVASVQGISQADSDAFAKAVFHESGLKGLSSPSLKKTAELVWGMCPSGRAHNTTPHPEVQLLTRRLFNYFAVHQISPDPVPVPTDRQTSPIKPEFVGSMGFDTIRITRDKGQGLYFNVGLGLPKRLVPYLPGDSRGRFPYYVLKEGFAPEFHGVFGDDERRAAYWLESDDHFRQLVDTVTLSLGNRWHELVADGKWPA